jgi:glyoxylase-like metal-dependent hydrolase (beta-lactamase superfamily II)
MSIVPCGEVRNGLYALGLPEVPVYLLRSGPEWTLIEGGAAALSGRVLLQLYQIVGDLRKVTRWLITHSHYDHCGSVAYLLPMLPAVRVSGSRAVKAAFASSRAQEVVRTLNAAASSAWWRSDGPTSAMIERRVELSAVDVDVVEDGSSIELAGDRTLQVIATPGHSACQVAFYDRQHSMCFVSDALGEQIASDTWCPLVFHDARSYLTSLRRLEALGAETTLLAHHAVLDGVDSRRAYHGATAAFFACRELARHGAAAGGDATAIAKELTRRFGARSQEFVSDALHLSSMQRMLKLLSEYDEAAA